MAVSLVTQSGILFVCSCKSKLIGIIFYEMPCSGWFQGGFISYNYYYFIYLFLYFFVGSWGAGEGVGSAV